MKDFKVNNFDSVKDFVSYTEAHYLPLLDRLTYSEYGSVPVMTGEDMRLLSFLHDDLKSFVNNCNE